MTQSIVFYGSGAQSTYSQHENIAKLDLCFGADCTKPLLSRCTPKPCLALSSPAGSPSTAVPVPPALPPAPPSFLCKYPSQLCTAALLAPFPPGAASSRAAQACCPPGRGLAQVCRDVQFQGPISRGPLLHAGALPREGMSLTPATNPPSLGSS